MEGIGWQGQGGTAKAQLRGTKQIGPTKGAITEQKRGGTVTEMRRMQEGDAGETSKSRSQKRAVRAAGSGGRHGEGSPNGLKVDC